MFFIANQNRLSFPANAHAVLHTHHKGHSLCDGYAGSKQTRQNLHAACEKSNCRDRRVKHTSAGAGYSVIMRLGIVNLLHAERGFLAEENNATIAVLLQKRNHKVEKLASPPIP